jgi:ABC-type bacteriocin/lantibiotic exporter with double-glycine peptidase domain
LYQRLLPITVLIWSGYRALSGDLSLGSLVAALQAIFGFGDAAVRLQDVSMRLWALRGDLRRIRSVLAVPEDPKVRGAARPSALESEAPSAQPSAPGQGRSESSDEVADAVRLDNVWFRYDKHASWALANVSLHVRRGSVHHLIGKSGCGKSTLLRLLAGLYAPEQGTIMLAGRAPESARGLVAYLPQNAALVQGTLHDNLRLLSGGASDARIAHAAAKTGLDRLLGALPMGEFTIVGAGASSLSGGQRQLVLLTACVASTRPIVLLDEAFAHLDPLLRDRLSLEALFLDERRTVISVTHEAGTRRRQSPLAAAASERAFA